MALGYPNYMNYAACRFESHSFPVIVESLFYNSSMQTCL